MTLLSNLSLTKIGEMLPNHIGEGHNGITQHLVGKLIHLNGSVVKKQIHLQPRLSRFP